MQKRFLLLQGVSSPFFARLADRLIADGYEVWKVNFNGGDAAYWFPRKAWHFRGDVGSNTEHPTICGRCVSNLFGEGEKRFYA